MSLKELMTKAQGILHKTAGGVSFFDRLKRDGALRDQLLELIHEM